MEPKSSRQALRGTGQLEEIMLLELGHEGRINLAGARRSRRPCSRICRGAPALHDPSSRMPDAVSKAIILAAIGMGELSDWRCRRY